LEKKLQAKKKPAHVTGECGKKGRFSGRGKRGAKARKKLLPKKKSRGWPNRLLAEKESGSKSKGGAKQKKGSRID